LIAFSVGSECFPRIQDGRITPPDVHSLPEAQRRIIAEVNISKQGVKVSRFDKVKALELLGKHLAMFTERAVVAGDPEAPLVIVQAKE
jgi:phage terminase small subunit